MLNLEPSFGDLNLIIIGFIISTYLCSGVVNHLLGGQVTLVSYEQLVDVLVGIAVNFLKPLLDVVVGLLQSRQLRQNWG